jgi:hypothetical protein
MEWESVTVTPEAARAATLVDVWSLLVKVGACDTNSEARRAIEGNSFRMFTETGGWVIPILFALADNQKPRFLTIGEMEGMTFRVGKRFFFTPRFK